MSAPKRPNDEKPRRRPAGNKRVSGKEQFYTPAESAERVTNLVLRRLPETRERLWVEPCGGTGAFLDAFAAAGVESVWSCDIEPLDPRVAKADFLALTPPRELEGAVVVTNPPFGTNNALSVPVLNKAAEFASVIAFIVPRSWRKWSVTDRLDPRFHLVADEDLAVDYEDAHRAPVSSRGNLRTCVQVWQRRVHRRDPIVVEDRGYVNRSTPAEADVSLTVFGRGCGRVKAEFSRIANTTQAFLCVRDAAVVQALRSIDYSRLFKQVAYTEALSLREVNFLLNEYFDREAELAAQTRSALDLSPGTAGWANRLLHWPRHGVA